MILEKHIKLVIYLSLHFCHCDQDKRLLPNICIRHYVFISESGKSSVKYNQLIRALQSVISPAGNGCYLTGFMPIWLLHRPVMGRLWRVCGMYFIKEDPRDDCAYWTRLHFCRCCVEPCKFTNKVFEYWQFMFTLKHLHQTLYIDTKLPAWLGITDTDTRYKMKQNTSRIMLHIVDVSYGYGTSDIISEGLTWYCPCVFHRGVFFIISLGWCWYLIKLEKGFGFKRLCNDKI